MPAALAFHVSPNCDMVSRKVVAGAAARLLLHGPRDGEWIPGVLRRALHDLVPGVRPRRCGPHGSPGTRPSSAWLGTCVAIRAVHGLHEGDSSRRTSGTRAWPSPRRRTVRRRRAAARIAVARASPASHQSGSDQPSVVARPDSPNMRVHHFAEAVVHLGDLDQVPAFFDGERVDPVVGAPEALRGHGLHDRHAREERDVAAASSGSHPDWAAARWCAAAGCAQRLGLTGVEGFERVRRGAARRPRSRCGKTTSKCGVRIFRHLISGGYWAERVNAHKARTTSRFIDTSPVGVHKAIQGPRGYHLHSSSFAAQV